MFQQREASIVFERVNRTGARIVCTRLSVSADHVRKRRRAVRKRVSQQLFSMRFPYYLANWSLEKAGYCLHLGLI